MKDRLVTSSPTSTGHCYDQSLAARLIGGCGAAYGLEADMRAWAAAMKVDFIKLIFDAATDTVVFIAGDWYETFVCFRGTADLRNWITDLECELTTFDQLEDPKIAIHAGFRQALASVWREIEMCIDIMNTSKVWFAGHSLGGALAMLAGAVWQLPNGSKPRPEGSVYTFGQPRVGNQEWRNWYDARMKDLTYRVIHAEDIVARVPWLLNFYRHAGHEIFYDCAGVPRQDVPWFFKAPSDVFGALAEWRSAGRIALLADHHWLTYQKILQG